MRRIVNRRPQPATAIVLAALPFVLVAVAYAVGSQARLAANPNDKLLPSLASFATAMHDMALVPDPRSGDYLFWIDTAASLLRLVAGVAAAALIGFVLGIAIGLVPIVGATLSAFVAVLSMIPPLAVLPILFIVLGLGELSKVVLIVIGIAPFLVRDVAVRVGEIPAELLVKAQTLGASSWQIVTRIVGPMILPRLIGAVRLSLGAAWLFLIAAEAIAATEGLGYRIFLVRRFLAMDVILPYVAWITLLAWLSDLALARLSRRVFAWAESR
ncbi:MAG: ABC transporter permease subunit [Geminicoccaceae bacterium]